MFTVDHGIVVIYFYTKDSYKKYLRKEFKYCYQQYLNLWKSTLGTNSKEKQELFEAKIRFATAQPFKVLTHCKDPKNQTVTILA